MMFAVAAAMLAATPSAIAKDWRIAGFSDGAQGLSMMLVDSDRRPGPAANTYLVTTMWVYETPLKLSSGARMTMFETERLIDCSTMQVKDRHVVYWGQAGAKLGEEQLSEPSVEVPEDSLLGKALMPACKRDYSGLAQIENATPLAERTFRFAQRNAVGKSLSATGWRHFASGGNAPNRSMFFLDKDSISVDAGGRRVVTLLGFLENGGGERIRYSSRVRFDCPNQSSQSIYHEEYVARRRSAGTVLQYPPEVHGPTTTIGRAREIVCKEDWTSAPETQKSADTLALEPFPEE